ncbi:MAG: FtsX-like permease family protein [Nitrosomonas sp.]|nr:FtsX-like permease family protein [Nitrosomonas sp.]
MNRQLLSRWLLLGEWRARRLQLLVAIIAIMLGVALGFSIHLVNTAAVNEFSAASKSLTGLSDLTVVAAQPTFDERRFSEIMQYPEVTQASPILEMTVGVPANQETLRSPELKIIGLDVFRAAAITPDLLGLAEDGRQFDTLAEDALFLSPAAMEWLAIQQGDKLTLALGAKLVTLRVAGGLVRASAGQRIGVMDIGAAQWHFDHVGLLSRIELKLHSGVNLETFKTKLAKQLGEGFLLMEGAHQDARIRNLSRAYRVNLNILALVALFTGAFLVFSSQVLAAVRRRPQIALLRVLGMSRQQLLYQLLLEGGLLGTIGALLGLMLGYLLAAAGLYFYGADLGAGFFTGMAPSLHFSSMAALLYFLAGVGVTLLGSFLPAWEATRTQPALVLKSGSEHETLTVLRFPWLAGGCLLLAAVFVQLPSVDELPVFGYLAVALLLIGGLALLPWLASVFFGRLLKLHNRHPKGAVHTLVLARLSNASGLAAIALGGVLASFSLMVAMAIMVMSFRVSVENWLTYVLPADIYVRTVIRQDARGFTQDEQQLLTSIAGIERIDLMRSQQILLDPDRPMVTLIARPIDTQQPANTLPMTDAALSPDALPAGTVPIWVSEAMVDLYQFTVGRKIKLPLGNHAQTFVVAGVWRDYGRQFGAIQIQLADYRKLTGDMHIGDAAIWIKNSEDINEIIRNLHTLPFEGNLKISPRNEIRETSLALFDRSFTVTYLLELIAVGVGLLGVAASFSAQALTRIKEFGMLSHIGFTQRQIRHMLMTEGGLLTGFGIMIGFVLGVAISLILVFVINPQSFRWTMQLHLPLSWLAIMAFAMLSASMLSVYQASKQAISHNVVRAVKEDW